MKGTFDATKFRFEASEKLPEIRGFFTFAPQLNAVLTFNNKNGRVGTFDFNKTPATFEGDVDESARIFVDAVCRMWGKK